MQTLLFVTDLYYQARQRVYYREDLFLSARLRKYFRLALCHPQDTEQFERHADLIVFRNAGPVVHYLDEYRAFRERLDGNRIKSYNAFDGQGDMNGKDYLVCLTAMAFPVIPTVDDITLLTQLPESPNYVLKPKLGADSIGLRFMSAHELEQVVTPAQRDMLIQPAVDFEYEVSFYFIDSEFQYALYAPDKTQRWRLETYFPTDADLMFAQRFVEWNNLSWGIQRVDACRTRDGRLLLVELEDLNPYLSLMELDEHVREHFVRTLIGSLQRVLSD